MLALQALCATLDCEIVDFELVWVLGAPQSGAQGAGAQHHLQAGSAQTWGVFCCRTDSASQALVLAVRAAQEPVLNPRGCVWQLITGLNFLFQILQKFGAEKPCEPRV